MDIEKPKPNIQFYIYLNLLKVSDYLHKFKFSNPYILAT